VVDNICALAKDMDRAISRAQASTKHDKQAAAVVASDMEFRVSKVGYLARNLLTQLVDAKAGDLSVAIESRCCGRWSDLSNRTRGVEESSKQLRASHSALAARMDALPPDGLKEDGTLNNEMMAAIRQYLPHILHKFYFSLQVQDVGRCPQATRSRPPPVPLANKARVAAAMAAAAPRPGAPAVVPRTGVPAVAPAGLRGSGGAPAGASLVRAAGAPSRLAAVFPQPMLLGQGALTVQTPASIRYSSQSPAYNPIPPEFPGGGHGPCSS
jgi:hypothetical protein